MKILNSEKFLNPVLLKYLKWIHVIVASFMLGGIFSMLILILLKKGIKTPDAPFLMDYAIYQIFNIIITYSFIALLFTAAIYGTLTKWRFFKYYWIMLKWVGLVILYALVWLGWGESINGMAALSDGGLIIPGSTIDYQLQTDHSYLFTVISFILILAVFLISILKPWSIRKTTNKMKRKYVILISIVVFLLLFLFQIGNYFTLKQYRGMPVHDQEMSRIKDGIYPGEMELGGFLYKVEVSVQYQKINDIKLVQNRENAYARFAEGVIPRIIKKQTANVSAITGATTTSKALMKAVENALSK